MMEELQLANENSEINIYDPHDNFKCNLVLRGHLESVYYLCQLDDGILVSYSFSYIHIWSITKDSYTFIGVQDDPNNLIYKIIKLSKERFATCCLDEIIQIWNGKPPYNLIEKVKGHESVVTSIIQLQNKEVLVSASFDNTLLFFDLDSYKNTNIIDSILCSWNNSLYQSDEAHLFIGGYNQISVYNINSNQIISIIEGTFGFVDSFISFGDDCILYGCGDGSLCVI